MIASEIHNYSLLLFTKGASDNITDTVIIGNMSGTGLYVFLLILVMHIRAEICSSSEVYRLHNDHKNCLDLQIQVL